MIRSNFIRSIRIYKLNVQLRLPCRGVQSIASQDSDRDTFGTLSERGSKSLAIKSLEKYMPDDKDRYDREEFDRKPRKNEYYYKHEIGKYARGGRTGIKKALELFHEMKSEARLTPDVKVLSPLIYGCARAGYTKKAFELYEESNRYLHGKPPRSVVTCLINACANSPFREYGLARLDWFMSHLKINHNFVLNRLHYNCAVKAYGKLGCLDKATDLVKQMIDDGILPDTELFNNLILGCSLNIEAGCTLALRVFKRLRMYGLQPDIYTFGLILKCIRSCDMGDASLIRQTLNELPAMTTVDQRLNYKRLLKRGKKSSMKKSQNFESLPLLSDMGASISEAVKPSLQPESTESSQLVLKSSSDDNLIEIDQSKLAHSNLLINIESNSEENLPNLLSDDHAYLLNRIQGIKLESLAQRPGRLRLFGGLRGFLETIVQYNCKPNAFIFSMLLPCLDRSKEVQEEYFQLSCAYKIQRDLVFYDSFVRFICDNYSDNHRLERAMTYFDEMHKDNIRPNVSTFEHLALGCNSFEQASRLIRDLESSGLVVSDGLIGNLFTPAIRRKNFDFLCRLFKLSWRKNYHPTKELVEHLEAVRLDCYDIIQRYEANRLSMDQKPKWLTDSTIKSFTEFSELYPKWLKSREIALDEHPWKQYHVETESKREGYKEFVKTFQALNRAKQEAIESGRPMGNLMSRTRPVGEWPLKN